MKTLNDITKKYNDDTFDNVNFPDLKLLREQISDEEKSELMRRLDELEEIENRDLDAKAEGFTDEQFENSHNRDLFAELLRLRIVVD